MKIIEDLYKLHQQKMALASNLKRKKIISYEMKILEILANNFKGFTSSFLHKTVAVFLEMTAIVKLIKTIQIL